jgi:NAD(P)-dependent dehydrogenase (short-subunit alcohol dehydrogenase family)
VAGRTVAITGATSGLGLVAAETLARAGARVLLIGRDAVRTESAARRIRKRTGSDDLGVYLADMSDLSQVRSMAEAVKGSEPRLDVLVHNAGALLTERRMSVDGYEMTFATMVLGPYLSTRELLPLLRESDDGRIVTVTSGGMYAQPLRPDDLQSTEAPYRGSIAYARAKRGQVVLTRLWARQLERTSVVAHAMHPGWADTPGVEASLPRFRRLMGPLLRTPEEGADTIVWLAAAPEAAETTGKLWLDRRPRPLDKLPWTRVSAGQARALWQACERMVTDAPASRSGLSA